MKKRILLLSLLSILMIISSKGNASAACLSASQYGSVTIKLPKLPSTGTYNIWTRMEVPDSAHSQYKLEVNGKTCFEVGGSTIAPGQWQWVSFQDGNLSSKVSFKFDSLTNNTAKVIGDNRGVRVDRLLLVKSDCVPVYDGSNCQSDKIDSEPVNSTGATEIPPVITGPVSGLIAPSQTITLTPQTITKVVYVVDGVQIPTATGYKLDTTLLTNGSHKIALQITSANGRVINEATTLEIDNPQTAFSHIERWIRLNQHTAVMTSSGLGLVLLAVATYLIIKHIRLQKRLLTFHGF